MSRIPRHFINEVLARTDLVELIDARVPLKKKGTTFTACCPFHNEKTPSFAVSQTKQIYHCFGCGVSGNAISFLMEYGHLSFVEAVEDLARKLGMEMQYEQGMQPSTGNATHQQPDLLQLIDRVTDYYQRLLRDNQTAIDYLKQRGLSGQIAKDFRVGYAPDGWDNLLKQFGRDEEAINQLLTAGLLIKKPEGGYYDRFRDRVMFPIRNRQGHVIAFGGRIIGKGEPKYLNSPETPIFHKGNELYGLYEACQALRDLPRIIVVEGYMDVIGLVQHGIRNAVATLGTATTAEHIQRLLRFTNEVVFCFDGDKAGQAAAWRALEITLPVLRDGNVFRFLFLPEGEDPDSMVRKEGAEQFNQRVAQAAPLTDFLFANLTKSANLISPEEKSKLIKEAMQLINKVTAPIFQHMLFERLASLVHMDIATLQNVTKQTQRAKTKSEPIKKNPTATKSSPMRVAIALLLQQPQLITSLSNNLAIDFNQAGGEILQDLLAVLAQAHEMNTASLLEQWRDRPEWELLNKLAAWDTRIPPEEMGKGLLDIFERLKQADREKQIEDLLQKIKLNTASDGERVLLKELIGSKK